MDKVWKAKWIMAPCFNEVRPISVFHKETEPVSLPEHKENLKNLHMLIRKKITFSHKPNLAFIDITADDYYKLYINGEFVGQGPAPAYHFRYFYNRYDICEYLKSGDNVIAVHVYYQGLINRVWNSGDYRQGMIAEVYVDSELVAATDSTWKYSLSRAWQSGDIIGYDTQFLENIDSRLLDPQWKSIDFDDSHWENVYENHEDDHCLYMQPTPPVDVYRIKPKEIKNIEPGHYLIDFGREITGQFIMEAGGSSGQVIEIRCGEELDNNNRVRYKMRCNCNYQEFWTLSGREKDVLEFYDYKAFRYVEVIGQEESVYKDSFAAIVRHYPMDEDDCVFSTSDKLLNSIWEICKNAVKYGCQEAYLDCPSREKGQYLGDLTITGHSQIYLTGDLKLYKKAIEDFALSAFACPGLLAVSPGSLMQEIADYSMQWPMQLIRYYWHSGDIEFLERMYPVVQNLVDYFERYRRPDGLLSNVKDKWNLVDWPESARDGYDFPLGRPVGDGCHNVINAFYYGMIKNVNEIRDILGIEYRDELPELRQSFIKTFYDNDTRLFVDADGSNHSSLHSNALPLYFGITPKDSQEDTVELIRNKGLSCGVYMSYFVLKGLARVEEHDLVYSLLTSDSIYSWSNMLREGATTCFEAWGKDQKWNTSLCHPWASAPIPVMIEDIIGLKPLVPGWKEIDFSPKLPASLKELKLKFKIGLGAIEVKYANGEYFIRVPEGVKVCKG